MKGTKVFITGSSRGLGFALASLFYNRPNTIVYGFSRTIREDAPFIQTPLDLSDIAQVYGLSFDIDGTEEEVILINNAGLLGQVQPLGAKPLDQVEQTFFVNAIAPIHLMNNFIGLAEKRKVKATIVNISSGAGRNPVISWSTYCATKAALDMATRVAIAEHPHLRIASIAPGVVDTEMQAQIRRVSQEDFPLLERFQAYKDNNELLSPQTAAGYIFNWLEGKYPNLNGIFSVRDMF